MKTLKHIYTANQCTDANDCEYAIEAVRAIVKANGGEYTKATFNRLTSLEKKLNKLKFKRLCKLRGWTILHH